MSSNLESDLPVINGSSSDEPADLLQQLEQRSKELAVVNAITQVVARAPDITDILDQVLERLLEIMDLEAGAVFLLDEDGQQLIRKVARGFSPHYQRTVHRIKVGVPLTGQVAQSGQAIFIEDIGRDRRLRSMVLLRGGVRSLAGIPLHSKDRLLGVMNVVSREFRRFDSPDKNLLLSVGNQLAVAIDNAQLFEKSARLAVLEERYWLAREIHDTLAQGLVALTLQLELALTQLSKNGDSLAVGTSLAKALELARDNLEEARRSVMHLRDERMTALSLAEAIDQLALEFGRDTGVDVRAAVSKRLGSLPINLEQGMYRIAQEALSNVRRHAGARQVRVSLQRRGGEVRLTIRDDGIGFNPLATPSDGHFGIMGMGERASLLGGRLDLLSRPGHGAVVRAVIPLRHSA